MTNRSKKMGQQSNGISDDGWGDQGGPLNTPSVPGIDEELIRAEELCDDGDDDAIEAVAIAMQRNAWLYA